MVSPVAGAGEVFGCVGGVGLGGGDLVEGEIVGGVFDCTGDGTGVGWCYIVVLKPVWKSTATFFCGGVRRLRVIVIGGLDFSVFEHGGVAGCPVHGAADTFDVGICEDVVCV